jgi:hypothetical protein
MYQTRQAIEDHDILNKVFLQIDTQQRDVSRQNRNIRGYRLDARPAPGGGGGGGGPPARREDG